MDFKKDIHQIETLVGINDFLFLIYLLPTIVSF
jgi:hypothetical protein